MIRPDKTWMRIATDGFTRLVILVGTYAIKIPNFRGGARAFLLGLMANLNEANRWKATKHKNLARVLWCAPLGCVLVARRYRNYCSEFVPLYATPFDSCDNKVGAFAIEDGDLILLDYGEDGFGFRDFWVGAK